MKSRMKVAAKRIALLGFEQANALDLIGPSEVFATANAELEMLGRAARYEVMILAEKTVAFTTESGIRLLPHAMLRKAGEFDTLIVPGGCGLREAKTNASIATWLKARAATTRRVASICTGIFGLAASGLLDGRRATTHWKYARNAAQLFPNVRVESDAIFIQDGRFFTSAGLTAGIDLALAFVEADHGPAVASAVARELVVYLKRDGDQAQYSEPLQFQMRAGNRFSDLIAWMTNHLQDDLSVETLAARVHLGARHFSRQFRATFDLSPADYVESLRLDAAMKRLTASRQTVEIIAASVGFRSDDAFRRAFERRLGVAPSIWRRRFSSITTSRLKTSVPGHENLARI